MTYTVKLTVVSGGVERIVQTNLAGCRDGMDARKKARTFYPHMTLVHWAKPVEPEAPREKSKPITALPESGLEM